MVYHKLNDAKRKDHYNVLFINLRLERWPRLEYYNFIDSYVGYKQIVIIYEDQEKTTFIIPYGT